MQCDMDSWNKLWNTPLWLFPFFLLFRYWNEVSESIFLFMCSGKFFIFRILAAVVCELSIAIQSSRAAAMKRTDRRAIGTECLGCQRMFGSIYPYDQHRRSPFLRGSACYALADDNRLIVTAAPRPNMSTAALERRQAKRTRGRGMKWHIRHILQIQHILHITQFSDRAYPLRVGPIWDCIKRHISVLIK